MVNKQMIDLNLFEIVLLGFTGLTFFSTIVCGLWLGFSGEQVDLGAKIFHIGSAVLTLVSTALLVFLLLNR